MIVLVKGDPSAKDSFERVRKALLSAGIKFTDEDKLKGNKTIRAISVDEKDYEKAQKVTKGG